MIAVVRTLIGEVVSINKQCLPIRGQGRVVYSKPVVLGGDVALSGPQVDAGLVHTTIW